MVWQLQDAKQKLSELIRRALSEGPQLVTRRGEPVVVVVDAARYEELAGGRLGFVDFLLEGPPFDDLDLERGDDMPREVTL